MKKHLIEVFGLLAWQGKGDIIRDKIKRFLLLGVFACGCITLAGCLTTKKVDVQYNLSKDMTGQMTLNFVGVHSDMDKPEEQKAAEVSR